MAKKKIKICQGFEQTSLKKKKKNVQPTQKMLR